MEVGVALFWELCLQVLQAIAIGGSDGHTSGALASGTRSISIEVDSVATSTLTIAIGSASGSGGVGPVATSTNAIAMEVEMEPYRVRRPQILLQ